MKKAYTSPELETLELRFEEISDISNATDPGTLPPTDSTTGPGGFE